tara:strand:+ start:458 stop:754 length:297 start_codon:yes stop_codon:yes gene_type:complete
MDILSIPLGFSRNGEFLKVDDASDEYKAEQIKAFVSTHKGEHPLFPSFGTDDPTFDTFTGAELISEFSQFYGSTIVISDIDIIKKRGAVDTIEVNFKG